jgi:hypothetical protein
MDKIQEILRGFLTMEGRLQAALILFMLIWSLKNIPWIQRRILTSDRAKLLSTVVLALTPAAAVLADPTVPAEAAWHTFLTALLGAMGIQGGAKAVLGTALQGQLGLGEKAKILIQEKTKTEEKVEKKETKEGDKKGKEGDKKREKKGDKGGGQEDKKRGSI